MRIQKILFFLSLCLSAAGWGCSCSPSGGLDPGQYRRVLIHSHNDYVRSRPYFEAVEAGAASVEADVWLVEGELYIAHDRDEILRDRTLMSLYLDPIRDRVRQGLRKEDPDGSRFQLLVDLKNEGERSLEAIVGLIEREGMIPCFDASVNPGAVRLVITGDAVPAGHWDRYPSYVCFDGRPGRELTAEQWSRIPLVSQNIREYSSWKGWGQMSQEDRTKIRAAADEAHRHGARFRLWGMPDTPRGWELTVSLGIDYINTDQPARVSSWLASRQ